MKNFKRIWISCCKKKCLAVAKVSSDLDSHYVHHLKFDSGNHFDRWVVGQVDSLAGKVFVLLFAFVVEGDLIPVDHQRVDDPLPLMPLYMRSHLEHIGMHQFGVFFQ